MGRLLLLSCCAPCSCAVIDALHKQGRDFAVLFYNPNIAPQQEYEKRKEENKKLCLNIGVDFIDLEYDHNLWLSYIKGFEAGPERGERCKKCFRLRLERAADYAKQNGFASFTSVLGVSRHKNMEDVNAIGLEVAAAARLPYDDTNWRKGGFDQSRRQLIKEHNIYNQTYCGCEFSVRCNNDK